MWANTDAWVKWFESQSFKTSTEYFLYLIDESDDYEQIERWGKWMDTNPGPGKILMSMATISLPVAAKYTPSLDIPTSWMSVGISSVWKNSFARYKKNPDKKLFFYNSNRPATGSFAIEDDGVALRVLAWTQYKMGIHRWFYYFDQIIVLKDGRIEGCGKLEELLENCKGFFTTYSISSPSKSNFLSTITASSDVFSKLVILKEFSTSGLNITSAKP